MTWSDLNVIASIDWTPVLVALIAMVGSLGSAAISAWVVWQIRTPSGMSIGKQVEGAHLTAIVNNRRIDALNRRLGVAEDEFPENISSQGMSDDAGQ